MVYLLHFAGGALARKGTSGARHYLGYCLDGEVERRLRQHNAGSGARITAAAVAAGLTLVLVRTWPGDRKRERSLKRARHFAERHCKICRDHAQHSSSAPSGEKARALDVAVPAPAATTG
jgi:predicted GIY-YIG superfamily endonuclease